MDEVGRLSGLPIATVSSTLALMELKGLVRQVGGMNYVQGARDARRVSLYRMRRIRRRRAHAVRRHHGGGSGTRLWPLSRRGLPKQALKLIGDRTMFQHTVDRLAPLFSPERVLVGTNAMAERAALRSGSGIAGGEFYPRAGRARFGARGGSGGQSTCCTKIPMP